MAPDPALAGRPRPSVSVIIPALNEAHSIAWVLDRLPTRVSEVVLVDGLSTDLTEVVARQHRDGLTVVHQHRPGKGAALRAGFAAATGQIIVTVDADGSHDPAELNGFVRMLEAGADFVKGSRYLVGGGSGDLTRLRRAGNRGLVRLANLFFGCEFTDLCYGYCAFWRRHLDALALTATGFEIETQLALNAVKAGLEIREVASIELPRRAGASNLNAFRDGQRVLRTMMDERPGRDSRAIAEHVQILLERVELPFPGSADWRPAGYESPQPAQQREDRLASGRALDDGAQRRRHSAVVYRVSERSVARLEIPTRSDLPLEPAGPYPVKARG